MRSICVFCGSSVGANPDYEKKASLLGAELAKRGIELIYGGGKIGLMGVVADACMKGGGKVTGIIPKFLAKKEIAHESITELITVQSMHERKLKMSQLAEGFVALPGGYGTLEEFCEMLTWVQLSLISKPLGILNIDGYYDHLVGQFQRMADDQLLKPTNLEFFVEASEVGELLEKMEVESTRVDSYRDKFIHT